MIVLVAYLAVLAGACVWTLFGGSLLFLLTVVLPPAVALLKSRMALSSALALGFVAGAWAVLIVFVVSHYTRIPPILIVVVVSAAVGVFCAVRLVRVRAVFLRLDWVDLAFTGVGGVVWCGVLLAAVVAPGGTPLSWAMAGDAANNVLFARSMLAEGGISLGIGQNPVPLTAAFIALFVLPSAVFGPAGVDVEIIALAQMWSAGIVAACVMCGALALSLVKRPSVLSFVAVATTSVLPLGWFLLSGPIVLGFVNFHFTIAVLVASLVALVNASRSVLTSLVTISLSLTAVLALWAPLAGIPGTALLLLSVVHRRRFLALRRGRMAIAIVGLAQPIGLFFALSVPSIVGQGEALQESTGAVFELNKAILAVVLAMATGFGLLHIRSTKATDMAWVFIAVAGGGGGVSCGAPMASSE